MNVGSGVEVYDPDNHTVRTLVSGNGTIGLVQSATEIDVAKSSNCNFYYEDYSVGHTITVASSGTYYDIDVPYTIDATVPADWALHASAEQVIYQGTKTTSFMISFSISAYVLSGGNAPIRVKIEMFDGVSWLGGVGIAAEQQLNPSGNRNWNGRARFTLSTGDRIRTQLLNRDETSNVRIQSMKILCEC